MEIQKGFWNRIAVNSIAWQNCVTCDSCSFFHSLLRCNCPFSSLFFSNLFIDSSLQNETKKQHVNPSKVSAGHLHLKLCTLTTKKRGLTWSKCMCLWFIPSSSLALDLLLSCPFVSFSLLALFEAFSLFAEFRALLFVVSLVASMSPLLSVTALFCSWLVLQPIVGVCCVARLLRFLVWLVFLMLLLLFVFWFFFHSYRFTDIPKMNY